DCLHLCIYPWKYNRGDKIKGSAYKDHIGIDKHGKSIIDRVQSPVDSHPNTQGWWPEGAEFCAVKTSEGYIFEGSYSRNALAPLKFETGSRFSLAATYIDYDDASCRKGQKGILLFFGTGNVEGKIEEFGQLILVE
ncbi:MAG: hypothetical protein WCP55_14250, partial [Lentisphaerota bacterium]